MGWKVPDLSDYLYAAARNGGPIGMSPIFSRCENHRRGAVKERDRERRY
jgi:hypothetical protein